ncbi:DNA-binding transcriptional regulator, AcrR family [Friedmanniella luteola]|uniref:DNA-binding transcriptional regulator, AcrR family n=1 Tax=Friedmanniella luteola TaxID=546871 RepID=A0A1H1UQE6_9ACTN|nr:TetR/AcrR family transcriptional regulator [Friedmanniella luteola]SDS74416.1 DNA-binding transcriptional regulator, AcrR family [Friedmanniella luteola]
MQVTAGAGPSPAAAARRAQVVAATLEVIAEAGYAEASFARIAAHAGLSSTRLISYHFASKEALIGACVEEVVGALGREVGRRLHAETTASGRLRTYITAVVEFSDVHRREMSALLQILLSGAWSTEVGPEPAAAPLEALLRDGQRSGEFRDFDPAVVAAAVQRSVEALPFRLAVQPDLDCAAWARELVELFDRGTRRDPA